MTGSVGTEGETVAIRHRFNVLPYDSEHPDIVVVVCDCGWGDMMTADHGSGWDAAVQYARHIQDAEKGTVAFARYSGDPEVLIGAGSNRGGDDG